MHDRVVPQQRVLPAQPAEPAGACVCARVRVGRCASVCASRARGHACARAHSRVAFVKLSLPADLEPAVLLFDVRGREVDGGHRHRQQLARVDVPDLDLGAVADRALREKPDWLRVRLRRVDPLQWQRSRRMTSRLYIDYQTDRRPYKHRSATPGYMTMVTDSNLNL